ncbi:ATPase [Campylobacter sp. MIT 99-7217]|uniref:DUF4276 family protein n=1 Tax=Campylobacter sp. MIT 99-7217 TaxID=535091 RepID=UPI001157677B|nr:DUF4276 family protein [Campylobacter sp. MIT 99-7217]TQR33124.1 ATPase [Campylobacter sp. MIT 99-7217]
MSGILRCYIICEGQSEEKFVKDVLYGYFQSSNICLIPLMIPTSKGHKGGGLNYDRVSNFIKKFLNGDKEAFVTTFFDYYGLDKRFLEGIKPDTDIYEKIKNIQDKFDQKIKGCCDTERFFSHIQPHEFESLLFSDIGKIIQADAEWKELSICELENIINKFDNPELINNSKETSPSHRLEKIFHSPKYRKILHGSNIAKEIGIDNIRSKCQHFNSWCVKLNSLRDFKK